MTLKADLDELGRLSTTLRDLSDQAAGLGVVLREMRGLDSGFGGEGFPTALLAASRLCDDLLVGELIPGIRERLRSTSFVMAATAAQYRGQDDAAADRMVATYRDALGDWSPR